MPVGHVGVDATLDEEFWAIVCADPDLLQAEFDQIMAADTVEQPSEVRRPKEPPAGRRAAGGTPARGAPQRRPDGVQRAPPEAAPRCPVGSSAAG